MDVATGYGIKSGERKLKIGVNNFARKREHTAEILRGILCPITLLPFSVMATAYGSNKFSSSISQVGLQLLIFKSRDMYKIKRIVKTGPPIEAEQMEPLKRNLDFDFPHKPPQPRRK